MKLNDASACEAASRILNDARQRGSVITSLPDACRPLSRADGYAVQAASANGTGGVPFGWKVAATSSAGQQHIAVSGPIAGRLFKEHVFASGARISLKQNRMAVAEPEFAFRMAYDLLPRDYPYEVTEVMAAVASLHPAIEVPDSRFSDFTRIGEAQLIADNACGREFVLGPAAPETWRQIDLSAHEVRADVTGVSRSFSVRGNGSAVLGDPRNALAWLANELYSLGITLAAGQVITTGACVTPLSIESGDEVQADFGEFGLVSARFF